MDDIAIIVLLVIVVLILAGIVLPIVALVIAINTKNQLAAQNSSKSTCEDLF